MYYEIDFIPVGDGEKGGDAAAMRCWDDSGVQHVFVVDGGTKESGQALVAVIRDVYKSTVVDGVFCTHPDADHSSGLTEVLEAFQINALIMHQPWDHASDIRHLFENDGLTSLGLSRKIRRELECAHQLKEIADRKGITIYEPFAGKSFWNGMVKVLGPSLEYYQELLPHFRSTPDPAEPKGLLSGLLEKAREVVEWVGETMQIETLTDGDGHFSAENSSSAILLFTLGADKILFTGDADIEALARAVLYANDQQIALNDLRLLDVPHHGSRHNVGPTVLNAIRARMSHISAPAKSDKHPAKKVVNALIRRGSAVSSTQGKHIYYFSASLGLRPGWSGAANLEFSPIVEK